MKKIFKASVREIAQYSCMKGDIDSRFSTNSSALEGTRLHKKIQKEAGSRYISEYSLSFDVQEDDFDLKIQGRADGIVTPVKDDELIYIDEIKTTKKNLDEIKPTQAHLAQAKIYAFIYATDNKLSEIGVRLSYCHVITEKIEYFLHEYKYEELEDFFNEIVDIYSKKLKFLREHLEKRDGSLNLMDFPFPSYRKNQRELAVATYRSIKDKKRLFLQAPTGIGKTISTIFSSLKIIGEESYSKLFYLTAKTTVRTVAEENLKLLQSKGADIKILSLTAKDKLCFMEKTQCNPDYCPYAKGYYDRLREVLEKSVREHDVFVRDTILNIARENMLCPFEFQLDLSFDADVIVCDYNYLFDPNASLKRFFSQEAPKNEYVFLVDEAHNLPDRAREMFSAEISSKGLKNLRKSFKDIDSVHKGISKLLSMFKAIEEEFLDNENILSSVGAKLPKKGFESGRYFLSHVEERLAENKNEERDEQLLELYFNVLMLLKIEEIYNEGYRFWVERELDSLRIRLHCLDPSALINEISKKGVGTVFFSATMAPMDYFKALLGYEEKDNALALGSPFDKEKRLVLLTDNVDTRYTKRDQSYSKIAEYIHLFIRAKQGNYIIFFPSYKYMEDVFYIYDSVYSDIDNSVCFKQDSFMSEPEREAFLERFNDKNELTHVGFCVMGGVFSEGIDLKGDRLIGVGIVGVGLPQICKEREVISTYFEEKNLGGFDYAYTYPGMNKVLQSVGRLIRSETDKGAVLLMDNRYNDLQYQLLLPSEMFPIERISRKTIGKKLEVFWE